LRRSPLNHSLLAGASLVACAALAGVAWSADPEASANPPDLDIQVGEEVVVRDGNAGVNTPEIELGGETFEMPELGDLPVVVEADEEGLHISVGDEVKEDLDPLDRDWDADDTPHRISFGHDVYVGPEETVEGHVWSIGGDVTIAGTVDGSVIAFAGDVIVEGEVLDDVVSVWGSVELDRTAICGGDVVAFGGTVEQNRGHVDGETLSLSFLPGSGGMPELEMALLVCGAASFLLFGAFAVILGLIFRENTERMLTEISERPFRAFWVGFGIHALGPLVFFLLLVTILGAPLAFLGWLLWWAVAQSGVVLGAVRLGQAVLRRPSTRQLFPGALVGGMLLHVPFIVGVMAYMRGGPGVQTAGILLLTLVSGLAGVLTLIGSGAVASTRFGEGSGPDDHPVSSSPLFGPMGGGADAT